MRFVPIALATAVFGACSSDYSAPTPTTPTPSAPAPSVYNSLSGKVIDESGICIDAAKVKVVSGQRAGQTITQTTPCNAWSYEGNGFEFTELVPDGQMTLRASAEGYASREMTLRPMDARGQYVFLPLNKAQ